MKLSQLPQYVRNADRLREVVSVLARYGLAPWLGKMPGDWIQSLLRTKDGEQISQLSEGERLKQALTELGTTYIKLGQVLSTRADLVGPNVATQLAELQSGTPADPPAVVLATIESELGIPADKAFQEFDPKAFASASIGQVHKAVLLNGQRCVVKVQHHDIEKTVLNDLEILTALAHAAQEYSEELRPYRPVSVVSEFSRTLKAELDFTREQKNLNRFSDNFKSDPSVRFPVPNGDLCTRRVLTMDDLDGISLSNREFLLKAGYDLSDIARRGAEIFLKMVFQDSFYHADPHPGNLMVIKNIETEDHRPEIGILDAGMVGQVGEELRDRIEDLLLAAIDKDPDRLLDAVTQLGELPANFSRPQLKSELVDFVEEYGAQKIDEFDLGGALNEMSAIIRRHHILLPSRASLLLKMLVMLEGTAQQLSPDFSLVELLAPYRKQAIERRLSPQRLLRRVLNLQRDWSRLLDALPSDIADILHRVRNGKINVHLEHQRLDSVANRLVSGILTAALFMGSALLWSAQVPPVVRGYSVFGAIGCFVALLMGASLYLRIGKSEKPNQE